MESTTRRNFIGSALVTAGAGLASTSLAAESTPLAPPDKQPKNLDVESPPAKQLGWAVVGLGELTLGQIMPAFGGCKLAKPVALISGHRDKALKVAKAHEIPEDAIYNYEDFDRIAQDKRIDVVYIVLPNSMHAEFTTRALQAGKHVLCEKPMAVTVAEGEQMKAAAEKAARKLAIAYRLHYEPMNRRVMEWCREKKFGKIKLFTSSNGQDVKAPNIRLSAKLGGGPVGDVGIYSINAARYVFNEEPVEVSAYAHQPEDDERFREVPESVSFVMRYASGALANCTCSFGVGETRRYRVICEKGYIEMDPAFPYRGLRLRTKTKEENAEIMIEAVNHFTAEMDGFSQAIIEDKEVRTPATMGIADLRIMTAIQESIASRGPARVAS